MRKKDAKKSCAQTISSPQGLERKKKKKKKRGEGVLNVILMGRNSYSEKEKRKTITKT